MMDSPYRFRRTIQAKIPNAHFGEPAEESMIVAAERELGIALPLQLRRMLLLFNGQERAGFWFRGNPIVPRLKYGPHREFRTAWGWLADLSWIVELNTAHRQGCQQASEQEYATFGPTHYHADLCVFVATQDAYTLAIDERPRIGGRQWQIVAINEDTNRIAVIAQSLFDYLDYVSLGIETSTIRYMDGGDIFVEE